MFKDGQRNKENKQQSVFLSMSYEQYHSRVLFCVGDGTRRVFLALKYVVKSPN